MTLFKRIFLIEQAVKAFETQITPLLLAYYKFQYV